MRSQPNEDEVTVSAVEVRMRFLVDTFQRFLDHAAERGFVIIEDGDDPDQYIQFKRNDGIVYAEVGSREWASDDERRPLTAAARARLAALGFTHGGPEHNYACDNLAQSAPYLADLYVRLYESAYESPAPLLPSIKSDIAPPSASGVNQHQLLCTTPVRATAGLRFRVERALRSNFAEIGSTTEDLSAVRQAVEEAGSWDALPEWAKDWIRKAEQGPLWVSIDAE